MAPGLLRCKEYEPRFAALQALCFVGATAVVVAVD
jgi:hypothetical protein